MRQLTYTSSQKFGHAFAQTSLSIQLSTLQIDTEGIKYVSKREVTVQQSKRFN